MYQEEVRELDQALIESKERAKLAEVESIREKVKREKLEKELLIIKTSEIKKTAKRKLVKQLVFRTFFAFVIVGIIFMLVVVSINKESVLGIVSAVLGFFVILYGFIKNPIRDYQQNVARAEESAREMLESGT